ncbi:MAG: hypothetical protein EKK63_04970 [Acinetobacter sp.]|uniref:hypothetical protein n=1 Tax=Acinetobacter sp. TaxID=472 RepID=UPI000FBF5872|nr:hypothetical protein [Acinetobacter sp.]RUP41609.1 MAG: hypothetical protein EKK63_04970 [Acinetobacter sp.]
MPSVNFYAMAKIGKTILFSGGDTANYVPLDKSTKEKLAEIRDKFGWINSDYRQSVPSAIEDAIAKPEDFIPFMFRHITATIVGAGTWKATEFTPAVLKAARKKLEFKPAYVNHEVEVSNNIGLTGQAVFTDSFTSNDGIVVPAGLDAPIWIDGKLHTDLTRKLSAYPKPHIQSVSIGVLYKWEPSHTFTDSVGNEDDYAFENRIGTLVDGKMVRRIVTEIVDIFETSLVFMGADPYAKIIDEKGQLVNIDVSSIAGKSLFSQDPLAKYYKESGCFFISEDSSLDKQKALYLSEQIFTGTPKSGNSKNNNEMSKIKLVGKKDDFKKEVLDALTAQSLEIEFVEAPSSEVLLQKDTAIEALTKDKKTAEDSLKVANDSLTAEKAITAKYAKIVSADKLDEFEKEVPLEKVADFARSGKTLLDKKREELVRLYKVKAGADVNADLVKTMESAEGSSLDALLQEYGSKLYNEYGAECKKCGATEITFKKSKAEGSDGGTEEKAPSLRDAHRI